MRKLVLFCLVASSILGLQSASAHIDRTSAKDLELSCLFTNSTEHGGTQVEEMEYQLSNDDTIFAIYDAYPAFYMVSYDRTTRVANFMVQLEPNKNMGDHLCSITHILSNKIPTDNLLRYAQLRGDKHGSVVCGLK